MRDGAGTLSYLFGDHLGSTSIVANASGTLTNRTLYHPWGGGHCVSGVRYTSSSLPTKYTYTGQYSYADDPATQPVEGFGLLFYVARMYDPALGRFTQADSLVPGAGNLGAWDRLAPFARSAQK